MYTELFGTKFGRARVDVAVAEEFGFAVGKVTWLDDRGRDRDFSVYVVPMVPPVEFVLLLEDENE